MKERFRTVLSPYLDSSLKRMAAILLCDSTTINHDRINNLQLILFFFLLVSNMSQGVLLSHIIN